MLSKCNFSRIYKFAHRNFNTITVKKYPAKSSTILARKINANDRDNLIKYAIQERNLSNGNSQVPKTPDLIYFPHLFRWLKTKYKFKYLQKTWDPDFSEGAFIYGSTQAVCRITEIITNDLSDDLNTLVTMHAKRKIVNYMKRRLTRTQKKIISIKPKDIKILVPMSVDLSTDRNCKLCKIVMRCLALKWFSQHNGPLRLVLVALESEFMNDYSKSTNGDWTISDFNILECTVLTETPMTPGL